MIICGYSQEHFGTIWAWWDWPSMVHWTFSLVLILRQSLQCNDPSVGKHSFHHHEHVIISEKKNCSHVTQLRYAHQSLYYYIGYSKIMRQDYLGRLLQFLNAKSCLKIAQFCKHVPVPVITSRTMLSTCEISLASQSMHVNTSIHTYMYACAGLYYVSC